MMTPIPEESHIYRAKFCVRDDINSSTPIFVPSDIKISLIYLCSLTYCFIIFDTGFRNYNLNTSDFPAALFLLGWIRIF